MYPVTFLAMYTFKEFCNYCLKCSEAKKVLNYKHTCALCVTMTTMCFCVNPRSKLSIKSETNTRSCFLLTKDTHGVIAGRSFLVATPSTRFWHFNQYSDFIFLQTYCISLRIILCIHRMAKVISNLTKYQQ